MTNLGEVNALTLEEDPDELSELPVYAIVTENDEQKDEATESLEKEIYRPFTCPACNKGFTRKGDMLRHHRKHTGEKPFQCSNCGDEFTRKDDMLRHLKTHQGIKPHKCPVCQKSFGRKADMVKHLLVHAGVKACGCPTCGCPFSHGGGNSTVGLKHFPTFSGRIAGVLKHGCPECAESFKRKMDLNVHIRSEHPEFLKVDTHSNPKHVIHVRKDESVEDMTINTEENEDVIASVSLINECEMESSETNEDPNLHLSNNIFENTRTRRGPKKAAKTPIKEKKYNRKVPEKYTSSQKQFGCPLCPLHFGRKADMIRHLKSIHSGLKPFTCDFCNKKFSRKEDCLRHAKTHSTSSKFTCKFCDVGFTKRTDYAMHILEHIDK